MKLSDYVAEFLARQGIRHVFVVSGGASIHLIDSIAKHPNIDFVCPQHEQAGAMAADGYARVSGNLGAAIATSGPGATNFLTGVCSAYYDSVPVIYITGQVSTFRKKGDTGVRQIGFQETDTVPIFTPVTKYAVQVDDPKRIRYELEKACFIAKTGRPGPVLIDIPDNIQREDIVPDKLDFYKPRAFAGSKVNLSAEIDKCIYWFKNAKRPLIILGWGIHLGKASQQVRKLIGSLGVPFVPTWAIADILPSDHPLYVGTFGTHGTRYANFAVQNADFILSIGSRLDTKATGSPIATFAREAKKIIVDVDLGELNKFRTFGLNIDLVINSDARNFIEAFNEKAVGIARKDISKWIARISLWKEKYPICPVKYYEDEDVNPYVFVKFLSKECGEGDILILDTGCALAWMLQAFEFKKHQRLFHDFNNTAMGWALPASIGAAFTLSASRVICVTGDGSLHMNIQELATVIRHQLPIKIFLINNHGYSMIKQTQDQWLNSLYSASTVDGGLALPNFMKVAEAYGFNTVSISKNDKMRDHIREALNNEGPSFCSVEISPDHRVIPQVKFGRPNEDAEPLLERQEFFKNMIIKPLNVSLEGRKPIP